MKIPKMKVYFYHLLLLCVVVLLCFYFMYKNMKRVEQNVERLYNRTNNLSRSMELFQQLSSPQQNSQNIIKPITMQSNNSKPKLKTDELTTSTLKADIIEENDEENNEENDEENSIVDLLEENEESQLDDVCEENIYVNDDEIDDLLNDLDEDEDKDEDKIVDSEDLSELSYDCLMKKKKGDLQDFLKSNKKAITGNKEILVKRILGDIE